MKWEYSYIFCESFNGPGIVDAFNRDGTEGWEMVGFDSKGYAWFKRQAESEPEDEVSRLKRRLIEIEDGLNRIQEQLESLKSTK